MKIQTHIQRGVVSVGLLVMAANVSTHLSGAIFHNLNFEAATVAPTPVGGFGDVVAPALAFPGWGIGTSGTQNPNFTLYNSLTIGSVAQVLVGPSLPNAIGFSPLQGNYSALLQFGPSITLGTPALTQRGMVPADALSINFLVGASHNDARVLVNGLDISLVPAPGGRLAGDISAFSGQEVDLMFTTTSYRGNWLYFDDIVLSRSSVPELSSIWLLAVGLAGAGLWSWRRVKHG